MRGKAGEKLLRCRWKITACGREDKRQLRQRSGSAAAAAIMFSSEGSERQYYGALLAAEFPEGQLFPLRYRMIYGKLWIIA